MTAQSFVSGHEWWSLIGGLLEVAGLSVVVYGLDKRQRAAGREGLWPRFRAVVVQRIRAMLVALKISKPRSQTINVGGAASVIGGGTVRAKGTVTIGGTLEEQVEKIKEALILQDQRLDGLTERLDREKSERERADKEERTDRESAIREVSEGIKAVAAGDLFIEASGVALFLVGVAFQTWGSVSG